MYSQIIFILLFNITLIASAEISRTHFLSKTKRQNNLDCPENEQMYQNNLNELFCDCEPGNIYHKETDKCYNAYTRGPCKTGQYLTLKSSVIKCSPNLCGNEDEIVSYNGKCHKLNLPGGPCPPISEGGGVLGVNVETYELGCIKEDDRLNIFGNFPKRICVPGSSRVQC